MNLSLTSKTALVCGATQGIGRAAAAELAALGASVVLVARNAEALAHTAASLPVAGGQRHQFLLADFSQPEALTQVIRDWVSAGNHADILVNNTGGPAAGPALTADPEAFLHAYRMHLLCNHALVQALAPGMKAAGFGRIINIISTSVKQPIPGLGVSNTTRGAVASWAKTLAYELGPFGITVNNVLPGFTETARLEAIIQGTATRTGKSEQAVKEEMWLETPARRFAQPEEVAAAVAFLASPAAAYINGINLPVDGGRTLSL